MAINLTPISNPEKVGGFNNNFQIIEDELNDNVLRRDGVSPGEPNHMEVNLDMNGNAILNARTDLGNEDSLLTLGDADKRYLGDVSEDIAGKVDKVGDTMSGTLDMGSNSVRNLLDPVQDQDAATKAYVDQIEQTLMSLITELHPLHFASVGDEIGGGIYCGTHTNGSQTWHLIFSKQDAETSGLHWANAAGQTGADDPDDGLANQNIILADFDSLNPEAFYHCRDYVDAVGNNDYYLPSRNELACAVELADMDHPEFTTSVSSYRWSSTESTAGTYSDAWSREFSGGFENSASKSISFLLTRPVRRVYI